MSSFVFFFKQKTAYEMRISDWSSDVCSSYLDREYLSQLVQSIFDPLPAVLERLAAVAILTAQEGAAYTARNAVISAGRSRRHELVAGVGHGDSMPLPHRPVCQRLTCCSVGNFGFMGDRKSTRLNFSHSCA